jgi:hypothetical protein
MLLALRCWGCCGAVGWMALVILCGWLGCTATAWRPRCWPRTRSGWWLTTITQKRTGCTCGRLTRWNPRSPAHRGGETVQEGGQRHGHAVEALAGRREAMSEGPRAGIDGEGGGGEPLREWSAKQVGARAEHLRLNPFTHFLTWPPTISQVRDSHIDAAEPRTWRTSESFPRRSAHSVLRH